MPPLARENTSACQVWPFSHRHHTFRLLPLLTVSGRIVQTGEQSTGGGSQFHGGFTNIGGQITSNGVTLETHTHSGVETGSGSTGGPN